MADKMNELREDDERLQDALRQQVMAHASQAPKLDGLLSRRRRKLAAPISAILAAAACLALFLIPVGRTPDAIVVTGPAPEAGVGLIAETTWTGPTDVFLPATSLFVTSVPGTDGTWNGFEETLGAAFPGLPEETERSSS